MKSITRLAALNRLLVCLGWGIPFQVHPNSLITDVLDDARINPYVPTPATAGRYVEGTFDPETETRDLKVSLIMLGRGGHGSQISDEGEYTPITFPHKATDSGLFLPMPLLVRPITSDLTGEQKAKYRLRTTMAINNVLYAVYWGMIYDYSSSEIIESIETVEDGKVSSSTPYSPTANDLRPQKEDISQTATNIYLRTHAGIDMAFTTEQVEDIVAACELMYGSAEKAVISEIAFCFGLDKPVTQMYTNAGTTIINAPAESREFVAAHVGIIESTFKPSLYVGAFRDTKHIGISEPLFGAR